MTTLPRHASLRSPSVAADEGLAPRLATRPVEAADDDDGNAIELAHDGLGGGRELVGHGQDGRLEHVAGGILLAEIALDRLDARHADGDVGQALAPGTSEGVGDDDAEIVAGESAERFPELAGRAVGVLGQETGRLEIDVGLVDAGIGADPAM